MYFGVAKTYSRTHRWYDGNDLTTHRMQDILPYVLEKIGKQIEDKGGTDPMDVQNRDFGAQTLTYHGVSFFNTRHITASADRSTVWIINIGPGGASLVMPTGQMWKIQGPKQTKGEFNTVWDIALTAQVVYRSPNAAVKIVNFLSP